DLLADVHHAILFVFDTAGKGKLDDRRFRSRNGQMALSDQSAMPSAKYHWGPVHPFHGYAKRCTPLYRFRLYEVASPTTRRREFRYWKIHGVRRLLQVY